METGVLKIGDFMFIFKKTIRGESYISLSANGRRCCWYLPDWREIKRAIPEVHWCLTNNISTLPLRAWANGSQPIMFTIDRTTRSVTISLEGKDSTCVAARTKTFNLVFPIKAWKSLMSRQADITAGFVVHGEWAVIDGVFSIGRLALTIQNREYGSPYICVSQQLLKATPKRCYWFEDDWLAITRAMPRVQSLLAEKAPAQFDVHLDQKTITFTVAAMPEAVTITVNAPQTAYWPTQPISVYMAMSDWNRLVCRQAKINRAMTSGCRGRRWLQARLNREMSGSTGIGHW